MKGLGNSQGGEEKEECGAAKLGGGGRESENEGEERKTANSGTLVL